jgi:hypothetical protein
MGFNLSVARCCRLQSAPDTVVELEMMDRDAAAANRALELLGKTDEVRLFVEVNELTGKNGGPIQTAETRDVVKDHLEGLSKRFAEGLKVIESGVPAKLNGRNRSASSAEDALNEASARWLMTARITNKGKHMVANAKKRTAAPFEGDAHALLVMIYQDQTLPLVLRIDAAKACLPFEKRPLDAAYNGVVPYHKPQANVPKG